MQLNQYYKDKKVLITGSSGFKGAWLTLFLHRLGAKVYGFSKTLNASPSLYSTCGIDKVSEQIQGDICKFDQVENCIRTIRPDIIFHLAAQALTLSAYEQPLMTFEANGMGTAHILEALRWYDNKCNAIIVTSDKCYRNNEWIWGYRENDILAGIDPYSASKSIAEIISHSYYQSYFKSGESIRIATCRAGNVIGGGDWNPNRIVPDCIRAWTNGEAILIRNPKAVRPWNYILDVLSGYLSAGIGLERKEINGQSFNFGPAPESEISVLELVKTLWEHWPSNEHEPYLIASNEGEFFEHTYLRLNSEKAATVLGWQSITDVSEGLKNSADWYKAAAQQPDKMYELSIDIIEQYLQKIS